LKGLLPQLIKLKNNDVIEIIKNLPQQSISISIESTTDGSFWTLHSETDENLEILVKCEPSIAKIFGNSLQSMSIIGFYVTIVFAIGRLIRSVFNGLINRVIYDEIPNPEPLLDFCQAIVLARNERELSKEKSYYDMIIQIFRSTDLLIKLTKAS
jgi:hypothetical protein